MSVYLGYHGRVELSRRGGTSPFFTEIVPGDVNDVRRRFSFEDSATRLITGDQVTIATTDGSGLDFIDTTGWANGIKQSKWGGFVQVDDIGGVRLYSTFAGALEGTVDQAIVLVGINRNIHLSINPDASSFQQLTQVTSYELNTNVETADTSALGDDFRTVIDTMKSGSGRLECLWDYTGVSTQEIPYYLQQLAIRVEIGQEFAARLYIKTNGDGTAPDKLDDQIWYEITGVVTNSGVQFSPDNVVQISLDFVTTGRIRLLADTEDFNQMLLNGINGNLQLNLAGGNVANMVLNNPANAAAAPPVPFLITLASTSIAANGTLGTAYNASPAANTSPQLSWTTSGAPATPVATWSLRCYDRAGGGTETAAAAGAFWAGSWIHWKVNDIPVATTSLAENGTWPGGVTVIDNDWINAGKQGTGYQKANGWGGPGVSGHTYEFFISAFDAAGRLVGRSNTLTAIST
jgi:phosphatidylethanolamine-binding protein (PEBP) family uncharacterized protein